jgi:hypothetical protein
VVIAILRGVHIQMIKFTISLRASTVLGAFALGALTAGPAFADTVAFTGVGAQWVNVVGGAGLNYSNNSGTDLNPQVLWGTGGSSQSGYEFDQTANVGSVAVNPPTTSVPVSLGTMMNFNQPIASGTAITSAQLDVTEDVSINGGPANALIFKFNFTHDETPNGDDPCPYGGSNSSLPGGGPASNGSGVNANGCADRETVSVDSGTATFMIGGTAYTVDFTGFQQGNMTTTDWLTEENATNSAVLMADVTAYSNVVAPAPKIGAGSGAAAVVMFLGGLGLAGGWRRWRDTARGWRRWSGTAVA